MDWFLIALLPPIFWGITSHIDKYLLTRFFKGGAVGAVMIFSASIAMLLLPIIAIIHPAVLHNFNLGYLLITANGTLYLLATIPYLYALNKDDASLTIPLFQMIPVISFILGYIFLGETLTQNQIIGGLIIIISAMFISLKLSEIKKLHMEWDVFFLMALSSFLYALNFIFFKYFTLETDFWTTSFWEYIGFGLFGIFLLVFVKSFRSEFLRVIKVNRLQVLGINGVNEVLNIIAKISFNFATTLTPVTIIWIMNGLQPLFVFILGIILTILFPKISKEDISKRTLIQRIIAIIAITFGVYLVNLTY